MNHQRFHNIPIQNFSTFTKGLWKHAMFHFPLLCLVLISHKHHWSHSLVNMYPSTEFRFILVLKKNDFWRITQRTAIIHSNQLGCKFFSYKWSNQYHNPHRPNICDQHEHQGHDKHSQLKDRHFFAGLEYQDRLAMTWHLRVLLDFHSAWEGRLNILTKQK